VLGLLLDAGVSEREQVVEAAVEARLFRDQELPAAYDLMSLPLPPAQRSAYEALSEEKRAAVRRQAVVALLEPFQTRFHEIREDDGELHRLLALGAGKARATSRPTLEVMYDRMGFVRPATD